MKIRCKNCEAFSKYRDEERGRCRRRPPEVTDIFGTDGFWPVVRSDDWCMCGVKKKEAMPTSFKFVDAPNGDVVCTDKYSDGGTL